MAACPDCGEALTKLGCFGCGYRDDHLETLFATMTDDLGRLLERRLTQLMEPRLEKMKVEILKALKEQHK